LTLLCSLAVAAVNSVLGLVIAWMLVRDDFPGIKVVGALIDSPSPSRPSWPG